VPWGQQIEHHNFRKCDPETEHDRNLWISFRSVVKLTEQFNWDADRVRRSAKGPMRINASLKSLFSNGESIHNTAACDKALEIAPGWCNSFAVADTLALLFQARFRMDWLIMFLLAGAGIGVFELSAHFVPIVGELISDTWLRVVDIVTLGCYIVIFLAIYFVFWFARSKHDQERFLDYRAFAEALRIAVFWKFSDIADIADAYPLKLPKELFWVKRCLLARELLESDSRTGGRERERERERESLAMLRLTVGCAAFGSVDKLCSFAVRLMNTSVLPKLVKDWG
jgi:hypothetical protein